MEVLKYGIIDIPKYQGQCIKCGTIIEVEGYELTANNEMACPVCLEQIWCIKIAE